MNIGIVFTTEKKTGGAHQYSFNMIEALKLIPQHDYFIFNFSPDFPSEIVKSEKNWQIIDLCTKESEETLTVGKNKKRFSWKRFALKIIDKLRLYKLKMYLIDWNSKKKVEIFYQYNLDLIFYPSISEFSYLVKIPAAIAIHDVHHRLNPQFPEVAQQGKYTMREYLNRRATKVAKYIFVDSEDSKQDIIDCYNVPADRVVVLRFVAPKYLGKNISKQQVEEFLNKHNLPRKFIFYPAQFWRHKNHWNLVKALAILKKRNFIAPLALIGSKQEEWGEFNRVMELIKDSGLEKQVYYLGYVDSDEVNILYRLAMAFVMPVLIGPTYIPILEAWQAECPVLYSNIKACKEQAGDAALLFDPTNPEEIAEKIELIWDNKGLRKQLIANGKERLRIWSWDNFKNKIKEIITDFEDIKNKDIQEIKYRGQTLALVFHKHLKARGVRFLTPVNYPLQVGLLDHKRGKNVPPHIHRDLRYKVNTTQEFLYVEKGVADITVFTKQWEKIDKVELRKGDAVLFISGAHGVNMGKNTRIFEIKQGPYPGDKKAKIFKDE